MNMLGSTLTSRMVRGPILEGLFSAWRRSNLRLPNPRIGAVSRLRSAPRSVRKMTLRDDSSDGSDDSVETPAAPATESAWEKDLSILGGAATQAAMLNIQAAGLRSVKKQGFTPKVPSTLSGGSILGLSMGTLALVAGGVGLILLLKNR